ncbi:MAG: hypothetical protein FJX75_26670 [Armatimonadetes bacterium]|nr:hypothetical protein [Armatimonadota bacterium]
MTCQYADALIEDVLNGEADRDGEEGLRQHLSHCGHCAEVWQVAWQVRQTLQQCEAPDPGESYFEQATVGIMARIRAIDPDAAVAEDSPAISSVRYGPLQIRGVGLALLMALGLLTQAFRPSVPYCPLAGADHKGNDLPGAAAVEDAVPPSPFAVHPRADANDHHPLLLRVRSLEALRRPRFLGRITERLVPSPLPQPLMT